MNSESSARIASAPIRTKQKITWRSGAALLVAFATATGIGVMVLTAGLDEHRPPNRTPASWPILIALLPAGAAVLWAIYRAVIAYRRRQSFDAVILPIVLPLCAALLFAMVLSCMNIWMDKTGIELDMTVTDVFTVDRGRQELDRYVVVSLPAEAGGGGGGGTAVWLFQRWTDLTKYAVGSKARIVWHAGYFGWPWCEYKDGRFPGYQTELLRVERRGTAKAAEGQFVVESGVKKMMEKWGIPVREVELRALPPAEGR